MAAPEKQAGKKSHQPANSRFTQQELPAQRLLLSPTLVTAVFFLMGLVFVPIGAVCLTAASSVQELVQRYDDVCVPGSSNAAKDAALGAASGNGTSCQVTLTLASDMPAPVFVYYELTHYYQNHRRYVKSRDDSQMRGENRTGAQLTGCNPERFLAGNTSQLIDPCGLVAWSLFNDTFQITPSGSVQPLPISTQGLAWKVDAEHEYSATSTAQNFNTQPALRGGAELSPAPFAQQQRFMVWMRTASTPAFRKLWGRIDASLKADAQLSVAIDNRYNSYRYGGQKRVVLSTAGWLGGRNPFLGTAYLVVGGTSVLFSLAFLALNSAFPRPVGDATRLSWNQRTL